MESDDDIDLLAEQAAINRRILRERALRKTLTEKEEERLRQGKSISEAEPLQVTPLNERGVLRYQRGDLRGAAADFEAALEIEPDAEEPAANLAVVRELLRSSD